MVAQKEVQKVGVIDGDWDVPEYEGPSATQFPWLSYQELETQYNNAKIALGAEPKFIVTSPALYYAIKCLYTPSLMFYNPDYSLGFYGIAFNNATIVKLHGVPDVLLFTVDAPTGPGVKGVVKGVNW